MKLKREQRDISAHGHGRNERANCFHECRDQESSRSSNKATPYVFWRANSLSPDHSQLFPQLPFDTHPRHNLIIETQAHPSMDSVNNTNMQSTEDSPAYGVTGIGHITGNQETASAWTSPISRPSSHPKAGKVMRTIFHWETGA
jgi:hypothetical protein